jgi:hypothetical protein
MQAINTESNGTQTSWSDVIAASSEAQPDVERETVEDAIDVTLTEQDLVRIARENAADDEDRLALVTELDDLKAVVKAKKSLIDAIDQRVRERNAAVRSGSQRRKGEWIMETHYRLGKVSYLDPVTMAVVSERALTMEERQTELPLDVKAAPDADPDDIDDSDAEAVTDPAALLAAAQSGEQDSDDDEDDDLDGDE